MPSASLQQIATSLTLSVVVAASALAQETHWSFATAKRPAIPMPAGEQTRSVIDAFLLHRLAREDLSMSVAADRRTLIRRLSLDLTGLPPTPTEAAAFVADQRPAAYELLVDEMLSRPQFGERMALRWLDLARYADTNGYSIDGGRHMWAWRDWVIAAYNDNMPFDQFTVEQIAGDLLPDATESQRIASGFNRNHMNTHEGGTILEECRVAYVADRVKTTAVTWMGLTVGCAQCHDHKYDPISQRDYYRFFSYFNTITDKGNDGNAGVNSVPFVPVYDEEQKATLLRLRSEITKLESQLLSPDDELLVAQRAWELEQASIDHTEPILSQWRVMGPNQAATANEAFTKDFGPEAALDLDARDADGKPLWQLREDLVDGKPHALPAQRSAYYLHRTITTADATSVDLSLGSDDAIRVWHNGALVVDQNVRRGVKAGQELITLTLQTGENQLLVKIINDGGPGGVYFKMLRSGLPTEVITALQQSEADRSATDRDALLRYFRSTVAKLEAVRASIAKANAGIAAINAKPRTTAMVMEEQAMPRDTFVLVRGRYDVRGDRVTAGTPEFLPPLPDGAPKNRLGLAQWLVAPEHPLTARVAVNGLWQMLFGTGIVKTSGDFGTQGERPSHPKLLDWLATEFVESGWDQKALIRRMVTSGAYRQASHTSPELLAKDPENRLLARGPSFRLAAELIRDQALAVSGLLNNELGGPSVRPYQPKGLWREMSHFGSTPATEQIYVQDKGNKLYRRSLYTIWKRTVPPPTMLAFDAPSRELCTPRRGRTNTPLQALVLLNETGFVEAARHMAQRMLKEGGDYLATRIDFGFELATCRKPTTEERTVLMATFTREYMRFAVDREAANKLIAIGESPRDDTLDSAEHAAWTMVASVLLNLSETVTKG
ncbi:MAG: hypothetical protein ACI89X_001013 [Planctomycetota bacterium]|jgi:hypothetical protein